MRKSENGDRTRRTAVESRGGNELAICEEHRDTIRWLRQLLAMNLDAAAHNANQLFQRPEHTPNTAICYAIQRSRRTSALRAALVPLDRSIARLIIRTLHIQAGYRHGKNDHVKHATTLTVKSICPTPWDK
jgi:hypothetical protein